MIASDVITQALRICGVIAVGETPRSEDSATGLEYLNDMLAEWHDDEVGLPDYSVAALTTTLNAAKSDKAAIAHQLAIRIGAEYGWMPTPDIMQRADDLMARLRIRYSPILSSNYDHLPGVGNCWDVWNG